MKKITLAITAAALLAVPALGAQQAAPPQGQPLTYSAVQARIQAQFAQTDTNSDGFLTQAEVGTAAATNTPLKAERTAAREQRRAKRAQRLARLDTNRDGTISVAERPARASAQGADQQASHAARQAKRAERKAERQGLRAARTLQISEKRFARLDANQDGRLALNEVTARAAKRFQRIDANGDGSITREERRAARAQRKARQQG